ncbi:MAG: hypothetical protein KF764_30750 [Labilithrix sp.]|nr:hypothetical protein [Labilithrix sp.]
MRRAGLALLLFGSIAIVVGTLNGYGSFFAWNGRHPVDSVVLGDAPVVRTLVPEPGRRYTVSVQVAFDRAGLETHDGATVVEAKLPLVVRVKDPAGTTRAEAVGWLDPREPPNVLYGQAAPNARSAELAPASSTQARWGRPVPELAAERLVGPFIASSAAPLSIAVDLGADRVGRVRIAERRLVVYDDALPPIIRNAIIVAAAGAGAVLTGVALLVASWFRRRGAPRKRGGIPAGGVV